MPFSLQFQEAQVLTEHGIALAYLRSGKGMGEKRGNGEGSSRTVVMICDGYPGEASRIRRLLSPRYDLVLSKLPWKALETILSGSFHAIVLGLHPKDRSYLEMIPILKKIRPHLPIIVVADGRSLEEQRSVQREGIFYFLPRPIGNEEMLAAIANAVEKKECTESNPRLARGRARARGE